MKFYEERLREFYLYLSDMKSRTISVRNNSPQLTPTFRNVLDDRIETIGAIEEKVYELFPELEN